MRLAKLLPVALALVASAACRPQDPGTVVVEGDSITWGWMMSGGGDGNVHATPGARIDWCPDGWFSGCVAPDDHLHAEADAGQAAVVELRLGTNDTADGWDTTDEAAWTRALRGIRDRSEPDSCVVLVLPWTVDPVPAERRAEVDEARAWLQATGYSTVDWRPYMERPGVAGVDGVHLATTDGSADWPVYTPEAHAAVQASHEEALARCA